MTESINVLIVDDHALVRKGLQALLQLKPGLNVIGEACDGNEAIEKAFALQPEVVLLDLEMPHKDGITALREMKQKNLTSKVLVLTCFPTEDKVLAAVEAGADGYYMKDSTPAELVRAIQDVYAGETPFDPSITRVLLRRSSRQVQAADMQKLTGRETMVLKLLAQGLSDREIGLELDISDRTVSTHVSHILQKLNLDNRTQAALYALKVRLVRLDDLDLVKGCQRPIA